MKHTAGGLLLLAAVSGCTATGTGNGNDRSPWSPAPTNGPRVVPGVQGSWGTPVPMIGPPAPISTGMPLSENNPKPEHPATPSKPKGTMVASAASAAPASVVQAGGTS